MNAPLAGFTIGVTAARRADELIAMLERKGASVLHGPAIRIVPLPDDTSLHASTLELVSSPVDVVVATTAIGFRGWFEAAEGWGLASRLHRALEGAVVLPRGPKAKGAVRAAGLVETWSPSSESNAEVLQYLLKMGVSGKRVAIQLHGEPLPDFVNTLRAAGADVVEIPVYRWEPPADMGPLHRLIDAVLAGQVDALTFTSAPAASSVLRTAGPRQGDLISALRRDVLVVGVGAITAGPLVAAGIPVVQPARSRIGSMVRELAVELPSRATRLRIASRDMEMRAQAVVIDGELRPVAPAPMAVLRTLVAARGRVVSRQDLLAALPSGGEEHAVETAIGRLRTALGSPQMVCTVVKRGYRLAMEPA